MNVRQGDHSKVTGVDERILKWIFKKWIGEALTGLVRARIGTGSGLLSMLK
jgi:hypothetical protein